MSIEGYGDSNAIFAKIRDSVMESPFQGAWDGSGGRCSNQESAIRA
jgi:hypothetical protein